MKNVWYYHYPIGTLGIAEADGAISHVFILPERAPTGFTQAQTPLIQRAAAQLDEYFAGKRKAFDLPLSPQGTAFRQAVWAALQTIPFGGTRSYNDVAAQVGNPPAARAVGSANHNNPIMILIPCHRVIGKNGALTGYAGGLAVKRYLLDLEKPNESPRG
jgi:methylated-DNA-[protein]-cysteine S-methyltransferase